MNSECVLKELIYRLIITEKKRFELHSALYALGVELNNEAFDLYDEILRDIVDADTWGGYLGTYIQGEATPEEITEKIFNKVKRDYGQAND